MNNIKLIVLTSVVILTFLILVGCNSSGQSQPRDSNEPETEESSNNQENTQQNQTANLEQQLILGAVPTGHPIYSLASAWTKVINEQTPIQVTLQATGGGVENIRLALDHSIDIGVFSTTDMSAGVQGKSDTLTQEEAEQFRAIFMYPLGGSQFITMGDSGIENIEDLEGRTVQVGAAGSTGEALGTAILEAYGVAEEVRMMRLSDEDGIQALQDGTVDAAHFIGGLQADVSSLSLLRPIRLLGYDEEHIPKILEKVSGLNAVIWQPDVYENMANTEPILTLSSYSNFGTLADFDENVVYEITKVLWENVDVINQAYSEEISIENAVKVVWGPLHKGALKYYQEQGVKIPDEAIPPEAD